MQAMARFETRLAPSCLGLGNDVLDVEHNTALAAIDGAERAQAIPAALPDSETVEHGSEDNGFGVLGEAAFWASRRLGSSNLDG